MFWRWTHRFLSWAPPAVGASYGLILTVAATAAATNNDARQFVDSQIALVHGIVAASWFLPSLATVVIVWLGAFLWSGMRATEEDAPPKQRRKRKKNSGMKAAAMTQAEYDAMPVKNKSTLYLIQETEVGTGASRDDEHLDGL
jgi:hypothetical protein